jgi:hypothetical protein
MDEDDARRLAGEWRRALDPTAVNPIDVPFLEHLVHALGGALPNAVSAVGAVSTSEGARIVVLTEERLFVANAVAAETETGVRLTIDSGRLADIEVRLVEHFVEAPRPTRRRQWSFSSETLELEVCSEQVLNGGFASERSVPEAEQLARKIAERLGWRLGAADDPRP